MSQAIYRWNGEYFGFIKNGRLFDRHSNYLCWIDENEVWKKNGEHLGKIVNGDYILIKTSAPNRARRARRAPPARPATPAARANRAGRARRAGYQDALKEFKS